MLITGALPPSRWTLRTKLVVSVLLLSVLVITVIGALTVWQLSNSLSRTVDEQLSASARQLANSKSNGGRGDLLAYQSGGGTSMQVNLYDDGSVIFLTDRRSGVSRPSAVINRLGAGEPIRLTTAQINIARRVGTGGGPSTIALGPAGRYRVIAVRHPAQYQLKDGSVVSLPVTTIIGLPLANNIHTVRAATLAVVLLSAAGLILVGLGMAYLVRRNLEPLRRVAATATRVSGLPLSVGEIDMGERVNPRDTDARTEVGQVGQALNQMLDNIDRALTARQNSETQVRQFVADASHELRTPLASIRGYAELSRLEPDPIPQGVVHALSRIESESKRMTTLVEDLLLLARLDSGRPLGREPVDVTLLAMETISDARAAGPRHLWMLELPDEPVELIGDEARIRQVLINLLANARRHTPTGTMITTAVKDADNEVVISVTDDGPGIGPELLPHILERFTRGDSARTRTEGSTGLGLSIVDSVATAHGGWMEVTSRPAETSFTIHLPRTNPAV